MKGAGEDSTGQFASEKEAEPTELTHVLGLTDMRTREMQAPFAELGRRGTLVTVNPDDGIRGYLSAVSTGSRYIERQESEAVLVYNGSGLIGVVGTLLSRYHDLPLLIRQNGDIFRQHWETTLEQVRNHEWRGLATHLPFALLTRTILRHADGFIPVTSALSETIHRQTGCPKARIVAAPNPVDGDEYAPPERENGRRNGEEGLRLLTVTNLNFRGKYEGVTELIDGVVPLLRRRPELEYVVAGDGRYYDQLNRYLEQRVSDDVRRRIRTPGFVEDIAPLYWDADVFLYASYIDGYPNVILEAQAARLPIVTNPAYGIAEQINDGESGLFVDPSDRDALRNTTSQLLDDQAERERLGRNARARVEAENDSKIIASQLYDAVQTIVMDLESHSLSEGKEPTATSIIHKSDCKPSRYENVRGGEDEQ